MVSIYDHRHQYPDDLMVMMRTSRSSGWVGCVDNLNTRHHLSSLKWAQVFYKFYKYNFYKRLLQVQLLPVQLLQVQLLQGNTGVKYWSWGTFEFYSNIALLKFITILTEVFFLSTNCSNGVGRNWSMWLCMYSKNWVVPKEWETRRSGTREGDAADVFITTG